MNSAFVIPFLYNFKTDGSIVVLQILGTCIYITHSVLTICTQTGTCDTQSGDLVFFSAAFDEFSVFTKK